MEAEVARRAKANGVTERTFTRIALVFAVAMAVIGVSTAVLSCNAGGTATRFGLLGAVGSGIALLVVGFVGRGSLAVPVWLLFLISALSTVTFTYPRSEISNTSARALPAGVLGLAIVVAAVTTQFAEDRRFATPATLGQVRISALTLVSQIGSAAIGLVSIVAVTHSRAGVSYGWFLVGAFGLLSLAVATAFGLRRS